MKWISIGDFKFGDEEKNAIYDVLKSNRITESKKVVKFENDFSNYIGTKYAVLMNSGTSALIAGLESLKEMNIKTESNIITTPLTYIATVNAIKKSGYNPVFVDVDPETFVITPDNILNHLEKINDTESYSLILPVHLMGYPADMDTINKISKKYGLYTFEDTAQAHGSLYKGKKCGSLSLTSAFSFYIAHNIQVGEMGALTTNNIKIAKMARRIKANGRICDCQFCTRSLGKCPHMIKENKKYDPRFIHSHIGYNFKTTEFMAAIGLVQLKRIDKIKNTRLKNVKILNEGLEKYSDILQLPKYSKNVSYMAYPMIIKKSETIKRDKFLYELEKNGVETRPLFYCIPTQQPAYNYLKNKYKGKLPNAEYISRNGFYIGCHQYLTETDLDYIMKTFQKILS